MVVYELDILYFFESKTEKTYIKFIKLMSIIRFLPQNQIRYKAMFQAFFTLFSRFNGHSMTFNFDFSVFENA